MCAIRAAERGLAVLLIEKKQQAGNKIRISGGGRCNFTNIHTSHLAYLSDNPHFSKSALARYTPWHFIELMSRYGLTYHEKTLGQLFCDQKSQAIIDMLVSEASQHGVESRYGVTVSQINYDNRYTLDTDYGQFYGKQLVVATGGPSIPKIGGEDIALRIAKQFHIDNQPFSPALVPLTLSANDLKTYAALAGVSQFVRVQTTTQSTTAQNTTQAFDENLLFTHRGLSGPAILQISSYWQKGHPIEIDFSPETALLPRLLDAKKQSPNKTLVQVLTGVFSKKLTQQLTEQLISKIMPQLISQPMPQPMPAITDTTAQTEVMASGITLQQLSHKQLAHIAEHLHHWPMHPAGTEGMKKAEVSLGGVLTHELSSKNFACHKQPSLYFIGEAVNVTGWLGGYNFQWAWASGWCCGDGLLANASDAS
ncbi:aminoacetone oxidase family FAD-binding enzyme [Cardiobacteriales bacterium ML27]|uniref:Aminoacetone oxidase family FAD-binding enzyme n=2 Tax=Ostreibacterium oceani TaxID=2654998 RepID=A0A6N7EXX3_9GAMM|nr:aminoacetone oxidase family FAD-binding enzyme [Ostreibacterium oceani]